MNKYFIFILFVSLTLVVQCHVEANNYEAKTKLEYFSLNKQVFQNKIKHSEFEIKITYQPTEILALRNLNSLAGKQLGFDALKQKYDNANYFLLELKDSRIFDSGDAKKTFRNFITFNWEKQMMVIENGTKKRPIIFLNEGTSEISGYQRILLATEKESNPNSNLKFEIKFGKNYFNNANLKLEVAKEHLNNLKALPQ